MQNATHATVLKGVYTASQLLTLIGHFQFCVGMRLHFLIFAALRGTPFSPLPYASKVSGLLEDLGMDTPPLESIGIGQLIGRIDRKWDTREAVRARISEHVPALRERAKLPNAALLLLLDVDQRAVA
jgi:polysaccharide pyruvyl transferase WcaK-like protein